MRTLTKVASLVGASSMVLAGVTVLGAPSALADGTNPLPPLPAPSLPLPLPSLPALPVPNLPLPSLPGGSLPSLPLPLPSLPGGLPGGLPTLPPLELPLPNLPLPSLPGLPLPSAPAPAAQLHPGSAPRPSIGTRAPEAPAAVPGPDDVPGVGAPGTGGGEPDPSAPLGTLLVGIGATTALAVLRRVTRA